VYLTLIPNGSLDNSAASRPIGRIVGHEYHPHAVGACAREFKTQFFGYRAKQGVRQLEKEPRAIACIRITTASATMDEMLENLDALKHDGMGLFPIDIGYKAKSARVVLVKGFVHSLG
jgi:hypothetical protein